MISTHLIKKVIVGKCFYLEKIKEETEGPLLEKVKEAANKFAFPGAGLLVKFIVF